MMLIAIVGGIGSGKSTVLATLRSLGATVLDADRENDALLCDPEYLQRLAALVPKGVKEGVVDREAVRRWMLADPANRAALERLAHPLLRARLLAKAQGEGVVCVELPVYVQDFLPFDEVWQVTADSEIRLQRIMQRNGWDRAQAQGMMQAQQRSLPQRSDVWLINDGDVEALRAEVRRQYERVKNKK